MARGGGREYAEEQLRGGRVDRFGTDRTGSEVVTLDRGPSGWSDEQSQGGDSVLGVPASSWFLSDGAPP